jgi:hypothetical protein
VAIEYRFALGDYDRLPAMAGLQAFRVSATILKRSQDCRRSRLSQACSYSDRSERLAAANANENYVLNEEFDLGRYVR